MGGCIQNMAKKQLENFNKLTKLWQKKIPIRLKSQAKLLKNVDLTKRKSQKYDHPKLTSIKEECNKNYDS